MSLKLLTSRLDCLLCSLLCMRRTPTMLHLLRGPCQQFKCWHIFCRDDWYLFLWFLLTTLFSVVGWREAAGCLLHLPRDVRQVLLYTAAPQWSSSLLYGSEQVGGGWGGASGGARQGEVTLNCFTLNYSVKVLCSVCSLVALSRSTSFMIKSFTERSKKKHVEWIQEWLHFYSNE